jgi:toxin ParE1/3/4
MKPVIYSPRAGSDLDEIYDYTDAKWGFQQAEDYIFEIRDRCQSLAAGTNVGVSMADIKHGYCLIRCGAHHIFYKDDGDRITIIRILHQRMNITAHLR